VKKVEKMKKIDVTGKCFATLLLLLLFCTPPTEAGREGVRMPPQETLDKIRSDYMTDRSPDFSSILSADQQDNPFVQGRFGPFAPDPSYDKARVRALFDSVARYPTAEMAKFFRGLTGDMEITDAEGRNLLAYLIDTTPSGTPYDYGFFSDILDAGLDVNGLRRSGKTLLMYARDPELIKFLVDKGADVNVSPFDRHGRNGLSALMAAVGEAPFATDAHIAAKALLDLGADVDAQDENGRTVITRIAISLSAYMNDELYWDDSKHVNNEDKDKEGAESRALELTGLLLDYGAAVNIVDELKNTALDYALSETGSLKLVRALVHAGAVAYRQTGRLSTDSLSGRKVVHKPSRPLTLDEKRLLQRIDELEDVNATDENGRNALMQMMAEKKLINHIGAEAIGRFLEQGLDIEARDAKGLTVLYYAQRRPELLKLLVEAGADVNAVVWTGDSLAKLLGQNYLWYGDRQDDTSLDTFAMLVDLGADLDLPNVQGETLLISIVESFSGYSYNDSDPKRTRSLERRGIRLLDLLAERGADVNRADVQGRTALTRIIRNNCNGNHNVLRKLLALGADPNRKNPQGQSPLMLLVEQTIARYAKIDKEQFEARRQEAAVVVDIFLQAGADANAIDNEGRSVLMYALKGGARPEVLEKLVKAGANVNAADNEGTSVLLLALKISQKSAIELGGLSYLLNAGIDPKSLRAGDTTALDFSGHNTFYWTEDGARYPEFKFLPPAFTEKLLTYQWTREEKNRGLLNSYDSHGPDPGKIELLVRSGADINARDAEGKTILMKFPNAPPDTIARLFALGLDPHARGKAEGVALVMATTSAKNLSLLIAQGVDVQERDPQGRTCLHTLRDRESVRVLLEAGAGVEAANAALMLAARYAQHRPVTFLPGAPPETQDYAYSIRVLLEHGADSNAAGNDGVTPLMALLSQPLYFMVGRWQRIELDGALKEALDALFEYDADPDARDGNGLTAWDRAWNNSSSQVLNSMREAAAKKRMPRNGGATVLMQAAFEGTPDDIVRLVRGGKDPNAADDKGWTALAYGARGNPDPGVVHCLIDLGADTGARDERGRTPLMQAVSYNPEPGVTQALLEAGVRPETRDRTGSHALAAAIDHDRGGEILGPLFDTAAERIDAERLGPSLLLKAAAYCSDPHAILALCDRGVSVDCRDADGQTPLMKAVSHNRNPAIARVLIDSGADIEARDAQNVSVMDYALRANADTWKVLLEAGIDLTAPSVYWTEDEKKMMIANPLSWHYVSRYPYMQRKPLQRKSGELQQRE
jgi:ankyrin repeat protein